jgi:hypothetical protein
LGLPTRLSFAGLAKGAGQLRRQDGAGSNNANTANNANNANNANKQKTAPEAKT